MYALTRSVPFRQLLLEQLPTFTVSLVVTEFFLKLGSFSLECIAFLAIWFVLDGLVSGARLLLPR